MRTILTAALGLILAAPAVAQSGTGAAPIRDVGPPRITAPGQPAGAAVEPGGAENGGPGAVGTVIRGGTGATSTTTDSGAAGNAERPEPPVGNSGGGGGNNGG